jgi:hypothetical protein
MLFFGQPFINLNLLEKKFKVFYSLKNICCEECAKHVSLLVSYAQEKKKAAHTASIALFVFVKQGLFYAQQGIPNLG